MAAPVWKRWAFSILRIFAASYLSICILVYLLQDRLVYFPSTTSSYPPLDNGLRCEDLTLTTKDGVSIAGRYVPVEEAKGAVLFVHGNAGNLSDRTESIRLFHNLGYSVLIFDYRGYGKSGGEPSEEGTYCDARAAWTYLVEDRKIPPERIVLFGRSLGGAVAAHLASEVHARGLILDSTFTSLPALGGDLYPFLPICLLCRYSYDTQALLPKLTLPVLIIHSRDDEMIPFAHGEMLFRTAKEPKAFAPISGSHNEGWFESGATYTDALKDFLRLREEVAR